MRDWLYGAWTYRSFYNNPKPVNDISDILLAEAEMVFEASSFGQVRGQLAFRSDAPVPTEPRLSFTGSSEGGSPPVARFRGQGVPGTDAEGWIYDYVAYLVPHWPGGGSKQATALVGSVTRVVQHRGGGGKIRPAGEVFSFIAVRKEFPEAREVIPLTDSVVAMLASRGHRLHHFVWHTLRNLWSDESFIPPQVKARIGELGWEPPRPVLSATRDPLFGNGSGEDFLFMHRQMIIEVNEALQAAGEAPIVPWTTIPPPGPVMHEPDFSTPNPVLNVPGNPDGFSVPPAWVSPDPVLTERLPSLKSPDFYWSRMRWWDRQFKDPAYLSTLTLGELGTLLEWTVHNDMHMRWASMPRDPENGDPLPEARQDGDIQEKWDSPQYDHLGEQYSSHVHPVFWRLHGWVDARIEDWFDAHAKAHPDQVTRSELMGTPWFEGTWVQVPMPWSGPMDMHSSLHQHSGSDDIKKMEEIVALVFSPPAEAPASDASAMIARARRFSRRRSTF